jgi:hypothetical protein
MPTEEAYKTCAVCRRAYTRAQWDALPTLGVQRSEDETGRYAATLKNCCCGGTMAIEVKESIGGDDCAHCANCSEPIPSAHPDVKAPICYACAKEAEHHDRQVDEAKLEAYPWGD